MNFLKIHYQKVIQRDLILTELVNTTCSLSGPTKFILSIGGEDVDESYVLSSLFVLKYLTGQHPFVIRKNVYQLNKGEALGGKLTLRGFCMYTFLYRLLFEILPRRKYFKGFKDPSHNKTFSFVIEDIFSFEELNPILMYLEQLNSIQCQLYFNTENKNEVKVIGQGLFFCWSSNQKL